MHLTNLDMLDYLHNVFNCMLCYIVDYLLEEELIDMMYYMYISYYSIMHDLDHLDHIAPHMFNYYSLQFNYIHFLINPRIEILYNFYILMYDSMFDSNNILLPVNNYYCR